MVRTVFFCAALLGIALSLSACETTNEDEWTGGARKPFDQAERTCEEQADRIAEASGRPAFFTECMRAFGWTRRSDAD
ncbi:MAG: hypothetical protein MK010_01270 [Erythrobacter sp.]|nr:hypothetical protein [Erythrobacter sp.]